MINKLLEIANLLKADKVTRNEKIKKLAQQLDEEDMEYIVEDMEKIDRGIHHIMEINGMLMQNQGAALSGHIQTTLLPFFADVHHLIHLEDLLWDQQTQQDKFTLESLLPLLPMWAFPSKEVYSLLR